MAPQIQLRAPRSRRVAAAPASTATLTSTPARGAGLRRFGVVLVAAGLATAMVGWVASSSALERQLEDTLAGAQRAATVLDTGLDGLPLDVALTALVAVSDRGGAALHRDASGVTTSTAGDAAYLAGVQGVATEIGLGSSAAVDSPAGRVVRAVVPLADGGVLEIVQPAVNTSRSVPWALIIVAVALLAAGLAWMPLSALERRRDRRALEHERALTGVLTREAQVLEDFNDVQRMKSDFLTGVSHSLRTTLHVIGGTAESLERHGDRLSAEHRRELASAIAYQSGRLRVLVEDLLEVEGLTTTVLPEHRADVLVTDVLHTVRSKVDILDRSLRAECGQVTARITTAHLERVLVHLVRNAAIHTPAGSQIVVRATRTDDGAELVVADDGPGIHERDRVRVFDPLSRLRADDPSPGLGLGLAVVRRIARLNGGRTWVATDPELGGTAVHVWIPDRPEASGLEPFDLTLVLDDTRVSGAIS